MAKTLATVTNYREADDFLDGRESRRIAHNTYVERRPSGDIAVRLHRTDVVTYAHDAPGVLYLRADGWVTVTTADRMNEFTPDGVRVNRHGADFWLTINGYGPETVWDGRHPRGVYLPG